MKTKINGFEVEGSVEEIKELIFNSKPEQKEVEIPVKEYKKDVNIPVVKNINKTEAKRYRKEKQKTFAEKKHLLIGGRLFKKFTISIFDDMRKFLEENKDMAYSLSYLSHKFFGYQSGTKTQDMQVFFKRKQIYIIKHSKGIFLSATKTPKTFIKKYREDGKATDFNKDVGVEKIDTSKGRDYYIKLGLGRQYMGVWRAEWEKENPHIINPKKQSMEIYKRIHHI